MPGSAIDLVVSSGPAPVNPRVTSGLVVYYPFTEGSGTTVSDQSPNGAPMDLSLNGAVSWLGSGPGVSMSGGRVGTSAAASKLINALVASGTSTFEVWALPANLTQGGPARLVSVGADNDFQNFVLGQLGPDFQVRLLHTGKNARARPRLMVGNGAAVAVQHLVHTYDGTTERFYIDGVQQPSTVVDSGNYSNWDATDLFNVGNGGSAERPFTGEIYLVAVYDRVLTPAEILQNYDAGASGTPPVNQAPVVDAGADTTVTLPNSLVLSGSVIDDGLPNPPGATAATWSQVVGTGTATFNNSSSPTSSVSFDTAGSYTLRLTVNDGELTDSDDVVITVQEPAPVSVPDVVGQGQSAAESAIVSAGLSVGSVNTANSDTVAAGSVISQDPTGGSVLPPGSAVDLVVSLGPTPVSVPDVTGQAQSTAAGNIVSAGFVVGNVTTVSSATVPVGDVVSQDPAGGSLAVPGSAIDLVVSSGDVSDLFRVIVLGSSTAAGTGASTPANSWVGRLDSWLGTVSSDYEVINLALSGATTRTFRPDGSGPPDPDTSRNVSRALEFEPDMIIINLPSNNVSQNIPVSTTMAHYAEIRAPIDAAGVPLFVTTTQPRNFNSLARRQLLQDEAVAVRNAFGANVIDIYDELTDFANNQGLKVIYDSGDGTHLNDAGHEYIFTTTRDLITPLVTP